MDVFCVILYDKNPYKPTTTKQTTGTVYDKATFANNVDKYPCSDVSKAPPKIAITRNEPPTFVSVGESFSSAIRIVTGKQIGRAHV